VLDQLAETRSFWNEADVEREVRSALGVRSGHEVQIASATRAVVGASLAIDMDAYTTGRVVSEERAVFAAAATLPIAGRAVELRAPDAGLDAQQRVAYTRLADNPDLAIVTGIAGAGKSRLLVDLKNDRDRFDCRTVLMRIRAFKMSLFAFSVGFPGVIKRSRTLFAAHHFKTSCDTNSGLLSHRRTDG
jgi:hypothetical protein